MTATTNKPTEQQVAAMLGYLKEDLRLSENDDEARGVMVQFAALSWAAGIDDSPFDNRWTVIRADWRQMWDRVQNAWNTYVRAALKGGL